MQEGGSAVRSLDNVRRFWLYIRRRKKFVPSVHAGVPGSDRGSHCRGTCEAERARKEKSRRRGRNLLVHISHFYLRRKKTRKIWIIDRKLFVTFRSFARLYDIYIYIYTRVTISQIFHVFIEITDGRSLSHFLDNFSDDSPRLSFNIRRSKISRLVFLSCKNDYAIFHSKKRGDFFLSARACAHQCE